MAIQLNRTDVNADDPLYPGSADPSVRPTMIVWEATRAFRFPGTRDAAAAELRARPGELSTHEAVAMIDHLAPFAGATLGITGGDPLEREDLEVVVTRARSRELRVVLALGATPRVTAHRLRKLHNLAGDAEIAVRLDGATPEAHDALRGFPGAYRRTLDIMQAARNVGFPVRIITTLSHKNVDELDAMAEIVAMTGATLWSVTFLAPFGRGSAAEVLDAAEHEDVLIRLAHLLGHVPSGSRWPRRRHSRGSSHRPATPQKAQIDSASDGRGFMFISSTGDVRPSRLLPSVGNVRPNPPAELYRTPAVPGAA